VALRLSPRDSASLVALAIVARELGDFDQQLTLLDKAFLLAPDNLDVRGQRAVALEQAGRATEAAKEFDAIAAKNLTANDWNNQCMYKAVANVELNRALEDCGKSVAIQDVAAFRDSRAFVMLRLKKFEESVLEYNVALNSGDFPQGLFGRAIAYSRLGKKVESEADIVKALKLDPHVARQFAGYGLSP